MIHAREDYNRIQDPANKIGEDEPVFLLRAKDLFAPQVIEEWADLVEGVDIALAEHVRTFANNMRKWQLNNKCKVPDSPYVGHGKESKKLINLKKLCRYYEVNNYAGIWNTECGVSWEQGEVSPITKGMIFCPFCGKEIFES